ncbi:MAG: YciI family protein [Acidimicrobiia bacterium]|nr:YciI family protein [Acidimicrobiia bacterium]
MKYALLIYGDESAQGDSTPEQQAEVFQAYMDFNKTITDTGQHLGGEALDATSTATTVRVRDGETLTTDGPFAETHEALGGFYLIEATDLDEAISIASRLPGSWFGSVEVRPVWNWENNQAPS